MRIQNKKNSLIGCLISVLTVILLVSCKTTQIQFEPSAKSGPISLIIADLGEDIQTKAPVGKLPQTIDLDKYAGKLFIFRSEVDPAIQQFWFIPNPESEKHTAIINLDLSKSQNSSAKLRQTQVNSSIRFLMKAYQHLVSKKFVDAVALADKSLEAYPENAGAHLVKALAYYYEGKLREAQQSITAAIGIDPEDTELLKIKQLIIEAQNKP